MVIAGGIIGLLFGKLIPERVQKALLLCNGITVMFIGAGGALSKMLVTAEGGGFETQRALLIVVSMALGTIVGSLIDLEKQIGAEMDELEKLLAR